MSTVTKPRIATPNGATAPRVSLADTIKTGKQLPSRVILHGEGGVGKSSWAAYAPSPIFLMSRGETGLHALIDSGQVPETPNLEVPTHDDLMGVIEELTTSEHSHKTVVLDVIDGFAKQALAKAVKEKFGGDDGPKGAGNYSAGDRYVAAVPMRELTVALDRLREKRQMAVILLAHTIVANYKNPVGPDYDRFVPDLYKDTWNLLYGWSDIVLFGYYEVFAEKEKGQAKAKGIGSSRMMATVKSAVADAKNRSGLTEPIEMGNSGKEAWQNFVTAIKSARGKEGGSNG